MILTQKASNRVMLAPLSISSSNLCHSSLSASPVVSSPDNLLPPPSASPVVSSPANLLPPPSASPVVSSPAHILPSSSSLKKKELVFDDEFNISCRKIETDDNLIKKSMNKYRYSLAAVNIRSISRNIDKLRVIIDKIAPDFILVSEIYKPLVNMVRINGYQDMIMKTRQGRTGGGVGIIAKKGFNLTVNKDIEKLKLSVIEVVSVKVKMENKDLTLVSIYRPPNANMKDTFEDFCMLMKSLNQENVIISGDLNIDCSVKNKYSLKYRDMLLENSMYQWIVAPTRITKKSETLIDHAITNIERFETIVTHYCPCDHQLILSLWGQKAFKSEKSSNLVKEKGTKLNHNKTIGNIFRYDWRKWMIENNNGSTDSIYNNFHKAIQQCLVHETKKVNKREIPIMPWMTREILKVKKDLDKVRKKFIRKKTDENEKKFRELKKSYNMTLNNARNTYFGNKLRKANKNSKEMWKVINNILQRKSSGQIINEITNDGKILKDSKEIADVLCNYYKFSAVSRIEKPTSDDDFEAFLNKKERNVNTFKLNEVKPQDVWHLIKDIKPKNSSGFDSVPSKIVTRCCAALISPIAMIINKCFEEGKFPDILKLSKITPVHKRDSLEPKNFRPLNVQSTFSKVIEKGAFTQWKEYSRRKYPDEFQFAYKENHSCLEPIILTRHLLETEKEKNKWVLLIMIDLSIAFETIETSNILPKKLEYFGADEKAVKFFKSFFCKRKHYVTWNGEESEKIELFDHSVVQGSVLGAPMYNTYTMDLNDVTEYDTIRFADDNNYVLSDYDPNDLIKKGNKALKEIDSYLKANTLLMNIKKTSYMILKPKDPKPIEITEKLELNGIEKVESARFLGIYFDDKLSFKPQFEHLKDKINTGIKALICKRNLLNYKAKMLLYHASIKSHIDYCCLAYFDKLEIGQMNELVALQKQAVRLIFRAKKKNTHESPIQIIRNSAYK